VLLEIQLPNLQLEETARVHPLDQQLGPVQVQEHLFGLGAAELQHVGLERLRQVLDQHRLPQHLQGHGLSGDEAVHNRRSPDAPGQDGGQEELLRAVRRRLHLDRRLPTVAVGNQLESGSVRVDAGDGAHVPQSARRRDQRWVQSIVV
jgi:hypothetical protein